MNKRGNINHNIDVRYEKNLEKAFDKFIEKWCGSWYHHLIDTDENDGQFIRDKIQNHIDKQRVKKAIKRAMKYPNDVHPSSVCISILKDLGIDIK